VQPLQGKDRKISIDDLLSKVVYLEQQLSITKVELAVKSADLLVTQLKRRASASRTETGTKTYPNECNPKTPDCNYKAILNYCPSTRILSPNKRKLNITIPATPYNSGPAPYSNAEAAISPNLN
jgi:hypothetical protein